MSKLEKTTETKSGSKQSEETRSGTVGASGGDGPKSDKRISRPDQNS